MNQMLILQLSKLIESVHTWQNYRARDPMYFNGELAAALNQLEGEIESLRSNAINVLDELENT